MRASTPAQPRLADRRSVLGSLQLTLLLRIALAFIVLSMAKERQELKQRVEALTDALTALPNRRALFEVADALGQNRQIKAEAISCSSSISIISRRPTIASAMPWAIAC